MAAHQSSQQTKTDLIEIFEELSRYLDELGEGFKSDAFHNAANALRNYKGRIISGQDLRRQKIKGIGDSSAKIIDEYLRTGQVKRIAELREEVAKKIKPKLETDSESESETEADEVIKELTQYYGIKYALAEKYYKQGVRSVEDLLRKKDLPKAIRYGIIYHEQIIQPIPHQELTEIYQMLKVELEGIRFKLVGSYRRKAPFSGDIDILAQSSRKIRLETIVERIRPYLLADLAYKPDGKVYRGIFRLNKKSMARRIDIKLTEKEAWPFALLHGTGSGQFNKLCRQKAISMGLKLSENGLETRDGKFYYPAKTEADIFNILKIAYLPPEERTKDITELKNI